MSAYETGLHEAVYSAHAPQFMGEYPTEYAHFHYTKIIIPYYFEVLLW